MRGISGVVDLSVEQQRFVPLTQVKYDREALARYGLPPGAAAIPSLLAAYSYSLAAAKAYHEVQGALDLKASVVVCGATCNRTNRNCETARASTNVRSRV